MQTLLAIPGSAMTLQLVSKKMPCSLESGIVKGTTARLPGVALNEHLCMEVSRQAGFPTATTEVSDDGQALVVSPTKPEKIGRSPLLGQR
jgi:hypothetical protein